VRDASKKLKMKSTDFLNQEKSQQADQTMASLWSWSKRANAWISYKGGMKDG